MAPGKVFVVQRGKLFKALCNFFRYGQCLTAWAHINSLDPSYSPMAVSLYSDVLGLPAELGEGYFKIAFLERSRVPGPSEHSVPVPVVVVLTDKIVVTVKCPWLAHFFVSCFEFHAVSPFFS